ncbi:MAG: diguanylate cyclase, partial [Oscillospiraceae bacterium]
MGLINLSMLIPDLKLIDSASTRLSIAIIRIIYTLILLIFALKIKSITSFTVLSLIISLCELIAVGIFLFVFSQYSHPSFLIQAMGLIIIILSMFLIPNRWGCMLSVSLFAAVGFFICASVFVGSVDSAEYAAAVSYIAIVILLCTVSAINSERHQVSEYIARTELERISTTDFLTDTANRLKMSEEAKRWIAFCKRHNLPLSLIFFDVDDLKIINDRYGHSAGDSLLT